MEGRLQVEASISEEDEEFDPMTKDFNDPTFNSYKSGPGSYISPNLHTQQRWEGEENPVYKLFVSDIPLGINDSGFQNIFSNFGTVLSAYLTLARSGKCKFGFIKYRTLREAERAIYSVNNIPPLGLSVKFAITDAAKQNRNSDLFETPISSMTQDQPSPTSNDEGKELKATRSKGRGQLLAPMTGMKPSDMASAYLWPKDYVTPFYSSGSHQCNRFSLPTTDPLLWSYHEALSYEKPVITSDRRFFFALGRGHAVGNLIDESERYCSSGQSDGHPCHKVYKYDGRKSEDDVVSKSRPCRVCSQPAVRICFNCQKRFCSKICFRSDSPNHVITSHGSVVCYKVAGEGGYDKCRGVFVKRLIFPPANFTDVPCSDQVSKSRRPLSNRNSHLGGDIWLLSPPSLAVGNKTGTVDGKEKQKHASNFNVINSDTNPTKTKDGADLMAKDKEQNPSPAGPLPFNSTTEVVVLHVVRRGEYYVNPCYLWDELMEMTDILTMMARRKQAVLKPTLHSIYIHPYQDVWCRAKVIQTDPELRILYIDYGNEEIATVSDLRELPSSMSTSRFPPMVVKIKVVAKEEGSGWLDSVVPPTKLSVRPITKDGEEYTVKVERECQSTDEESQPYLEDRPHLESGHVLRAVGDCDSFELNVTSVLGPGRFCGTLNLNPSVSHLTPALMESTLVAAASNELSLERVKLGEMVGCVCEDGSHRRGYVSALVEGNGVRVSLVDEAYVCSAQRLFSLPDSVLTAPQAAVFCLLDPSTPAMQVGRKVRCRRGVLKVAEEVVGCEVEGYGEAVLTSWCPRPEDVGLSTISLTSGSSVIVSSYYSPQDVYIQSLEPKHTALLDNLLQDVAVYASTVGALGREPEVGEMVACLHLEDRNYYRALIYRKLGNVFTVIYLDYGNSCDVTADLMKPLPDSLKMVPCCAVRIKLDGVSESLMTWNAVHFLHANACSKPVYLEMDEGPKQYVLKTAEGVSINGKLEELTRQQWKICLQQGTDPTNGEVFFGYDIKYLKWESGRKGNFLVVRVLSKKSCLVMDTKDGLLDLTKEYFTRRYSDYCSSFAKHFQYTPRLREICLVSIRDEKGWFRAVCTAVYDVSCWVVLVDFGTAGEVYFSDVRPITYELMQFPSILKKCTALNAADARGKWDKLKEGSIFEATVVEEKFPGVITANFENMKV